MTGDVAPKECPRCKRGPDAWTIERAAGASMGKAGCACGEVFDVTFLDAPLPGPLSFTPRKPPGFTEDTSLTGWRGRLGAPRSLLLAASFASVFTGLYARLLFAALPAPWSAVAAALVGLTVGTGLFLLRSKPIALSFEGGRFTMRGPGANVDVAMDEIRAFSAGPERAVVPHLLVHMNDGARHRCQLIGVDGDGAQYIADRANAMLAAGGRATETGYRGERIRVDPSLIRVETREPEQAIDDEEQPQSRARK